MNLWLQLLVHARRNNRKSACHLVTTLRQSTTVQAVILKIRNYPEQLAERGATAISMDQNAGRLGLTKDQRRLMTPTDNHFI
jgi:hypothetical protein